MLLARKDRLVVANVGDSRAVLCRGGQAVALTTEHRCDHWVQHERCMEKTRVWGGTAEPCCVEGGRLWP